MFQSRWYLRNQNHYSHSKFKLTRWVTTRSWLYKCLNDRGFCFYSTFNFNSIKPFFNMSVCCSSKKKIPSSGVLQICSLNSVTENKNFGNFWSLSIYFASWFKLNDNCAYVKWINRSMQSKLFGCALISISVKALWESYLYFHESWHILIIKNK